MQSRVQGCLAAIAIIVLAGSLFLNMALVLALVSHEGIEAETKLPQKLREEWIDGEKKASEKIVVLRLTGMITSEVESSVMLSMTEQLLGQLRQAEQDAKVKSIVIRVNSGGGEVLASDVLYHEIKKTAEKKPVVIYMESLAASGAFYAAMGGSYVMANELTLTGSIGVIVQTLTFRELGKKVGIEFYTFTSGPNKSMFGGTNTITPEQAHIIEGIVTETYGKFLNIVAQARKISPQDLRRRLADGRVITGEQAHIGGLVDELGYLEDAYKKAKELAGIEEAKIVQYVPELNFMQVLRFLSQHPLGKVSVEIGTSVFPALESGKLYYLSPHLLPQK